MKRIWRTIVVFLLVSVLYVCFTVTVGATTAYDTYTYGFEGEHQITQDAYSPRIFEREADIRQLDLNKPMQVTVDAEENIYICDTGNNRIVVLDRNFENVRAYDSAVGENGQQEIFASPNGIFVTDTGEIYIADTDHSRIVVTDLQFRLLRVLDAPDSTMFDEDFVYNPTALAVDAYGRIYVVAKNSTMGIICLNSDGEFQCFLGAQEVNPSLVDILWRYVLTEEQIQQTTQFLPTEYNNITIDEDGFLFVTTNKIDAVDQYNATTAKSQDSTNAPVRRLGPSGIDVLTRNGFYPPSGDVEVAYDDNNIFMPSQIIAAATTENGQYSLLDSHNNRIFTYDSEGNLLYAFSKTGTQIGTFQALISICYKGSDLLALDKDTGELTVFERTSYGDQLALATEYTKERNYTEAVAVWKDILGQNSNLELAKSYLGKSLFRSQNYEEAMEYFEAVNDVENYSLAYSILRKEQIRQYLWLILLVVIGVVVILYFVSKKVHKINVRPYHPGDKTKLYQDICYGFHSIWHPSEGAWCLTRERRGSIRGAAVILGAAVVTLWMNNQVTGYIFNSEPSEFLSNIFTNILVVLVPFLLWCGVNWAVTTLMSGEGSFRSIVVVSAYSLIPLILIHIPLSIVSNFMLASESHFYNLFAGLAVVWTAVLLVIGMMVIHDYSLGKNIFAILLVIVAMLFVVFLGLLFVNLVQRMWSFVEAIYQEVAFRI